MPHDHAPDASIGDRRLGAAVALNLVLTVAQVIGGIVSGSLALIADALHNFSDAASLIIAAIARRLARRPADARMTFGWSRAEIVAALVNFTTLILLGAYLVYEATLRLIAPEPVSGWIVVIVAGVALAVDLATVLLTMSMAKGSMNIRAAFLHNMADALASVAVILGGAVVILYDWTLIDPLVTLAIAAYVLWHGLAEIGGAIRILMNAAPEGLDGRALASRMAQVEGVAGIHHLHLWRIDERRSSVEAHVALAAGADPAPVKARLRALLEGAGVGHATLETEAPGEPCPAPGGLAAAEA
jgi:cobalt-zinc-cadmium efflux system protein